MSAELMSTKEVASYLGIHEKQVYALIKGETDSFDPGNGEMGLSQETHRRMDRFQRQRRHGRGPGKGKTDRRSPLGRREQ